MKVPPIWAVQRLRIENAKRRLERTGASIDEISWEWFERSLSRES